MCGAYTVIESWLTDQTPSDARGKVLAIYTFLTLTAITAGQFLFNLTPAESSQPFMLAGIFIALAMVPVSLTKSLAPRTGTQYQTQFHTAVQNAPIPPSREDCCPASLWGLFGA